MVGPAQRGAVHKDWTNDEENERTPAERDS